MNQTNNYQLCQWDDEDRILRADFNADNAKIDAAIADNAAAIAAEAEARAAGDFRVRLLDKTLQGGVTVDVDLSGIDFSPYVRAELYIGCPASMQSFTIRFNDITNYKSGSDTSSAAEPRRERTDTRRIRFLYLQFFARDTRRPGTLPDMRSSLPLL